MKVEMRYSVNRGREGDNLFLYKITDILSEGTIWYKTIYNGIWGVMKVRILKQMKILITRKIVKLFCMKK